MWEMVLILKKLTNRDVATIANMKIIRNGIEFKTGNEAATIPVKNAMLVGNNGVFIYFYYHLYLIFCQLIIDIY